MVMLKVSPMKRVWCLGKKTKLAPMYVVPFKVIKRIKLMTYRLELPVQLGVMSFIFLVLMKNFIDEEQSAIINIRCFDIHPNLTNKVHLVKILDV